MNQGIYLLILLVFPIIYFQSCENSVPPAPLSDSIRSAFDSVAGDFAVAFFNLENGDTILIGGRESFHAASTMKTSVMIEAFKQLKEKGQTLNDSIEIYNKFYSIVDSSEYVLSPDVDGDLHVYNLIGQKISWENLISRMITRSSNLATNILIDYLGAQNVTKTMRDLGAPYIQVLRGVEDLKAYEAGLNNTTTAYDLMMIYVNLANFAIVDSASCEAMIDVLLHQEFNSLIPAGISDEVKVAHKTGEITGVHHDSGIVILPDGRRYVLVILSKNVENMEKADEAMIKVSRLVYEYVAHSKVR